MYLTIEDFDGLNLEHFDSLDHAKRKKKGKNKGVFYLPLIPLRPFLVAALKKKKIPVKRNGKRLKIQEIAMLFKNHIIDKKPYGGNFDSYDHVITELTADFVKTIINWIKDLVNKKKRGEKLTKEQEAIADVYEKTEDKVNAAANGAVNESIGDFLRSPKGIALVLGLLFIAFIIGKKM